jgi:hypothetical protein
MRGAVNEKCGTVKTISLQKLPEAPDTKFLGHCRGKHVACQNSGQPGEVVSQQGGQIDGVANGCKGDRRQRQAAKQTCDEHGQAGTTLNKGNDVYPKVRTIEKVELLRR